MLGFVCGPLCICIAVAMMTPIPASGSFSASLDAEITRFMAVPIALLFLAGNAAGLAMAAVAVCRPGTRLLGSAGLILNFVAVLVFALCFRNAFG